MKGAEVLFSKKSDEWSTPQAFFNKLDHEFRFDLDAAATQDNRMSNLDWLGPGSPMGEDALQATWHYWGRNIWCNPPYSMVGEFVAKAVEAAAAGSTVVMLLPARTDTKWWHTYVWEEANGRPRPGVEVRFVKGRLKFSGSDNSAPFPSVVVVFRGRFRPTY